MSSLLEMTLSKLQRSTVDSFPDTEKRQHKTTTVKISNLRFIPNEGSNQLEIKAVATSGPNTYNTVMLFNDVYYEQTPSNQTVTFKGVDGQNYNIYQLENTLNDVKVRCSCMDFYYRFASSNFQNDSLFGAPPKPYVKKTNRPDANPENNPGMCKHLIKMKEYLETIGLLR